jgi:hypothetical protein
MVSGDTPATCPGRDGLRPYRVNASAPGSKQSTEHKSFIASDLAAYLARPALAAIFAGSQTMVSGVGSERHVADLS